MTNQTQAAVAEMPGLPPLPDSHFRANAAPHAASGGSMFDAYRADQMRKYATEYGSACMALKEAEVVRLREALTRLGSVEAFDVPRVMSPTADAELLARIDFARAALAINQPGA